MAAKTKSPRDYATLTLADGTEHKMRFDFDAVADADEYLGKSIVMAIGQDPMNFHYLRTAIYFASRTFHKDLRGVKAAGQLLSGLDVEVVLEAIQRAMIAGGVAKEDEEEEPEGEG